MTQRETRIAAVILALVACAVGLIAWGMRLEGEADRIGPLRSFALDGREIVAVFHANRLNLLDAKGHRIAQQSIGELLLPDEPNDMDVTVDARQHVQAWFFGDGPPRIVRCDFDAAPLRWRRCAQLLSGPQLKTDPHSRALHVAADPARDRVFVADAKGGVRALSLAGKVIADTPAGLLNFPNRIRVDGDTLWVADNDNQRLVALDIAGAKPGFAVKTALASPAHPDARGGHLKVTDFVRNGDALWLLAVAQGQKLGDVLVYGPQDKPLARASVVGFDDPLVMDRLGDGIVVGDFDGIALYAIGPRGEFRGTFGDASMKAQFARARESAERGSRVMAIGWSVFGATLVLGFMLAWKYGERPAKFAPIVMPAAARAARIAQPVTLEPDPAFLRRMRRLFVLAGAASVAIGVAPLWVLGGADGIKAGLASSWRVLIAAVLVLGMAVVIRAAWRMSLRVLTATEDGLEIRLGDKVLAASPWHDVWVSEQTILVGSVAVNYRMPAMSRKGDPAWLFDEKLFSQYVLPRVPPAQCVAQQQLVSLSFKRMPVWQQALIAGPVLALIAFTVWQQWR